MLHVADLDFRSNCNLFSTCLTEMAQWSAKNPDHAPIFVMLEAKGRSSMGDLPRATKVLPFEKTAYAEMDATIEQVFGKDKVIMPDDIRGDYATLESAVKAQNWPTLANSKGKFIFLLIAAGDTSDLAHYVQGRPNLEGRMAFLRSQPCLSHSAFVLMDNAIVRQQEIKDLVKQGYLVRTRSDIETYEAKVNDMSRAKAAFSSGAHIISTDFYKAGNPYGTDYKVSLPEGVDYLCNPINSNCGK
ncbi:Ca2+-dependent phosphoinositide-specific phospholipase C [Paraglaciecola aquimarina]|uniref:Ca2+-dependent phosphoinositide-specific phospholipase C n=1 Tax=Paraglaciecola aquimarina TaxID=1235557 RepID=A0ABU3T0S8_9ALTE|nr:Ca2+-dependent phosphoinositide-specific phospholipase C [Paraglaciecola aquimarina]MDU0355858.1 Ca2+-dependent phosphoinositide-specific phospholipase C [Paraglaciecola aquimarina]